MLITVECIDTLVFGRISLRVYCGLCLCLVCVPAGVWGSAGGVGGGGCRVGEWEIEDEKTIFGCHMT